MTLLEKQQEFALMVARLIQFAYQNNYRMTFGDAYRDPRVFGQVGEHRAYSSPKSLHKSRLAVDFNLFRDGKYLTRTEDYRELGEYWEELGGTWGGRFKAADGNHFSIEHEGRK